MRGLKPIPTKMEEPLLQELLQIAHSEAPRELGSSDLPLLSQPLSQWKNPVNYIPAVPSECVQTAEKSYLDRPYSTHWEDELLSRRLRHFRTSKRRRKTLCCWLRCRTTRSDVVINNLSTCGQVNMIFIDPTTSKETPTHSCVTTVITL